MKEFLDNIINRPFNPIKNKISEVQGTKIIFPSEHEGNFTIIPECLRRCSFLSSTEKEVLYELISWASTTQKLPDGYCKVTESHIRVNTNLGLSTVKKAISSLSKKRFISKSLDLDKRNIYKINAVYTNPYVILSEWVFCHRRNLLNVVSQQILIEHEENLIRYKKLIIEASIQFIKDEKYYGESIKIIHELLNKLLNNELDNEYINQLNKAYENVLDKIVIISEQNF
ncbi:hypothetical protein ACQQ6W_18775 [Lysinibacillus fusiformis]